MRRATQADLPALLAFLGDRTGTAMFPLSNLARYGLDGDAPRAMTYWIDRQADTITGVIGITNEGMVMPHCATGTHHQLPDILAGRPFVGLVGAADQVRDTAAALGCADWPTQLKTQEDLFELDLADLHIPDGDTHIIPVKDAQHATIVEWMTDYLINTLGVPVPQARPDAAARVTQQGDQGTHVVLTDAGRPVAMTGFNAQHDDTVMIGGVYTPPRLRGRGHARRAVALHLRAARRNGARRAFLTAHDPAAIAAYRAIGFRRVAEVSIVIFSDRQVIHG